MKKYDSYKDSGIDWIGEIPSHWDVVKLKNTLKINNGIDYKHVQVEEGYPVIGSGGPFAYASNYLYDGEVVLLGRKGTIDKPLYFKGRFWTVDTMFYGISNNKGITKFLFYISTTIPFSFYSTATALPSMTQSDLNNHKITLPPLLEQKAIADFLDKKCAQIDTAVSLKEQQIEKLKELRQSIIHQAVTQGLDKNAELKDSGVDWIGKIPKHWEVKRLKYVFDKIQTGTTPSTTNQLYFDGKISWYNPKDLNNEVLFYSEKNVSPKAIIDKEIKLFEGDSVLVVGIGATAGKTSYLKETATFNQQITGFKSYKKNNKFYFYLLRNLSSVFLSLAQFTTLPILNNEFFKKVKLPIPTLSEQEAIVTYLDAKTAEIDQAISLKTEQITQLKSYKQGLINEVVTGKVRVS